MHDRKRPSAIGLAVAIGLALGLAAGPGVSAPGHRQAICARWRRVAEDIMRARQQAIPMPAEHKALADTLDGATVSALISKAYDQPIFQRPRMKTQVVRDFRDSVYAVCLRRLQRGSR